MTTSRAEVTDLAARFTRLQASAGSRDAVSDVTSVALLRVVVGRGAPLLKSRLVRRCRGRPGADTLPQRNDPSKVIRVMHGHAVQIIAQCQARLS